MNEERQQIILGRQLATQIAEALGLDVKRVRRIVLDIQANTPVTAYVQLYGDARFLSVDWVGNAPGIEVKLATEDSGDAPV